MIPVKVYEALIRSGWHSGRKINKEKIVDTIIHNNFPVLENVVGFLEEFGNLKIHFHNKRNNIEKDDIDFNFSRAMNIEVVDRVQTYEESVKKKMCIIGTVYRDNMILLMANDLSMYAALDDELYFISTNPFEAMNSIFEDLDFLQIM